MKKNLVLAAVMAMMVLPTFAAKLVKVGIINNDPNESGYRTANVNEKDIHKEERLQTDFLLQP